MRAKNGSIEISTATVKAALGPFASIKELGKGQFGTTFLASRGDGLFVLKVVHRPDLPEYLWEREVNALSVVNHPNVVGFRGSGSFKFQGDELLFIEMEFIAGGSIEARLQERSMPEDASAVRDLFIGLLRGLAEIHELGIIHRDLKPGNVGLRDAMFRKPVLLDFGLAKVLWMSSHTEYPARIGTIAYMSPEQLRGGPARRRSDLFSAAVVVYEAGTGHHPFVDKGVRTAGALLTRIERGATRPSALRPVFDDSVEQVLMRSLSVREHQRLSVEQALVDLGG